MNLKNLAFVILILTVFSACESDDSGTIITPPDNTVVPPATYTFTRDGESTVNFSGQTTRILMGEELIDAMQDETRTFEELIGMFAHIEGNNDFSDPDLNASDKSIRSKTAASQDFFSSNATDQAAIRADFESWMQEQVDEVYPNWSNLAGAGTPGQLADGSSTRYVNAQGLELNQAVNKSLIGALMVDQALNNYLGVAILDQGDNVANNDNDIPAEGKAYTTMEHKWDEAYGYAYGINADPADPNADLGADSFLNKYIGRVEDDPDFEGIAEDIFLAYKLGRAAIVAKNYSVRDEQAQILREKISQVVAIRAVYYLQQGKMALNQVTPDYGGGFHDLSEGFGFIYSLQFTRIPNTNTPYFTKAEVDGMIADLLGDGPNGFWDVTPATLDEISNTIADRFGNFTVAEAASTN